MWDVPFFFFLPAAAANVAGSRDAGAISGLAVCVITNYI